MAPLPRATAAITGVLYSLPDRRPVWVTTAIGGTLSAYLSCTGLTTDLLTLATARIGRLSSTGPSATGSSSMNSVVLKAR